MKQITCPHCADTYPDFDVAHVCSKGPYAPKLKPKMNERIKQLAHEAGLPTYNPEGIPTKLEKFAELIVRECAKLNKHQSYELMGVITDVEEGDGFDDVCLNTVKRVAEHLAKDLKEHFGVEE